MSNPFKGLNKKLHFGAWVTGCLLALVVLALLVSPIASQPAQAEGEDEAFYLRYVRVEFDDNNNADGLRPTSNNSFYIYYNQSSQSGWYNLYANGSNTGLSWNNTKVRYFSLSNTTSNNWQYYYYNGWYRDGETAVIKVKQYERVHELDVTLNWSDNGNTAGIRPDAANFKPTLYLSSSNSSATPSGYTKIENPVLTIKENGDNAWSLHFSELDFQPSNSANRYVWLTWLDDTLATDQQTYFNRYTSNSNVGYMYFDMTGSDYSLTTIAKTDTTLTATLTWEDNSDSLGKRPSIAEFKPTLLLSNSSTYATSSYVKPVTIGENGYSIKDNGDNTWTITFTDVNVKELYSQNPNYRYLWLTWEGSPYYVNQVTNTYYYGYIYSDIANIHNVRWTTRSSIVRMRMTWQDNGDEFSLRPSVDEFKSTVKLLLSNTTANATSAQDVTGKDFTVTVNDDGTWDLVFYDTNARFLQTSNNSQRYLFLNWTGNGSYVNESLTYSQNNVTYVDMYSYNSGSSVIPYSQVPSYLSLTLNWRDNSDEQGKRPDPATFKPKLLLSNSTSQLTDENSKDVTGTNYEVKDNGNNTWTIVFKDTTARAEQTTTNNWRYLWLTWEGGGYYQNELRQANTYKSQNPYMDLYSFSTPNLTYYCYPSYVVATLTWSDLSDAAGMRPTTEAFKPTLHFSTSDASITGTETITTGNYTVKDNGNGTWTIVFWDTDLYTQLGKTSNWRYVWLTWEDTAKETQVYANNATSTSQYGFTRSSVHYSNNYGGENKLLFTAKPKMLQFRLNWTDDNSNFAESRPDPNNFVPHLWGSTSSSSAEGATEVTGSGWLVKEYPTYWIVTLTDADASVVRGLYNYFWLTWEDTALGSAADGDAKQYYYNQSKTNSKRGYTYTSASNDSYTFTAYSKLFNVRVKWQDNGNANELRPKPEEITWHLWYKDSNDSSNAGDTDLGGTKWKITDNGDDTWTITFLDSDLLSQLYSGNSLRTSIWRYLWLTWDGSEYYINDVKNTSFGYSRISIYTYSSSFSNYRYNGNGNYWTTADIYPKAVLATLTWHDNGDAYSNRPKPTDENLKFHLWYTTSSTDASSGTEVTGDYVITDNGDNTWDILFKNTEARKLAGTNTRYLVLTWDGSDEYYNTAIKSTEYGYTYASISRTVTNPKFVARQKAFQILLHWEDGDNNLGYRPSTDKFIPHVWRSNSSNGNMVEITGQNWTVKDNNDGTWLLSFPEPENLTDVTSNNYYIWLTWEGSDEYYNNKKDTSFGYMRVLATQDNPYYEMTTRAKQRELPLVLIWDDYSNGRNTRPAPTQFTPHLWYQAENYVQNQGWVNSWVEIPLTRDVDYQILTDQDAANKWTIRFLSIPYTYLSNRNGSTQLMNISNYVLTWDGSDEYYNQVMTSGVYGYMSVAASSYAPQVTTRLKERTLDLTIRWQDYSNEGGYRPKADDLKPQLYFGSNTRTYVPIDMSEITWTVEETGTNTWVLHFDNVPYAVSTTSGSTNTYEYYWLTWTGSDEYWNQRTSTYSSNSDYTTGCMYFSREALSPEVSCYLKTRSRNIRLYWQDTQNKNGWRPTAEYLKEHLHLWVNQPSNVNKCGEEIDLSQVKVIIQDTESSANYWDIRLEHLPYYFERPYGTSSYIDYYRYYWLTWDGEHYINQSKNDYQSNTPYGVMYFPANTTNRSTVYCYPDETAEFTLNVYWNDDSNEGGWRPDPANFDIQLYYGLDDSANAIGVVPASSYTWEVASTKQDQWVLKIKNLPRSIQNADGTETTFRYFWLNWNDSTGRYISQLRYYYYNSSYLLSRFSNDPASTSASTTIYLNSAKNMTVTLTWDDNNNADGLRPTKDKFKPILGYSGQPAATEGFATFMAGAFANVEYEIDDSQDASNKWTITFKNIPMAYTMSDGAQQKVNYYWFTCEDVAGYSTINPYSVASYSRNGVISSPSRTSSYTMSATLKRLPDKDISVTLNWNDNTNEWGRRPNASSFVPHLWAGSDSKAMREIPLTRDQWEITDVAATKWTLKLKNVETLQDGYYWLTWEGSDYYYNQFTNSDRNNYLRWAYNTASPSVTINPRKVIIYLTWQDGSNADGKRPDPNSWQPTLWYGTDSEALGQIPLSDSDWYLSAVSGNQWTVEFYGLPDQYTTASGEKANITRNWLTFDTVGDYYYSDRTTAGYGALRWSWNQNTYVDVYTKDRPLTITLKWSDLEGKVGTRPDPTPDSLKAHLWYGSSSETYGEFSDLSYTVTDNGDNTWTLVFDSVPGYYTNAAGAEVAVPCYWLTFDGGTSYLSNITDTFSGAYGAMYQSKISTNQYTMTAYCEYYRIGTVVRWSKTNNIANVSRNEIDHSHVEYDLVDTLTGETVVATWVPETPSADSYSYTFYVPARDAEGNKIDHHRYTVVQRGTPGVFTTTQTETDYTSGVPGHSVTINNEAEQVYYRFNFTFDDNGNALKLRPSTLQYLANEIGGDTYTYRGSISSISSTSDQYSSSIITLLGRDLLQGDPLEYEVELTNLGKYYDVSYTRRVDDDGVVNLDYTLKLKTQPVTLQVVWYGDHDEDKIGDRPVYVEEYLMANGVNMLQDNRFTFTAEDALEDDPHTWQKTLILPTVDADGNPIEWSMKQTPMTSLRLYHAEQENVQEENFGGQTVTLTNIRGDDWNYFIDLYWVSYGSRGSLPDKDYIDERNRYDIYETVSPSDDYMRKYKYELNISVNSAHYAVGDLEVRLPYYMKAVGKDGSVRWVAPLTPSNDIAVPMAPSYNPRISFNYYIDDHGTPDDLSDDEIVFVNWQELSASSNSKIQVIYSLYPDEHLDTHIYEIQAKGEGYAILNYDDETHSGTREEVAEQQESNVITFGMDTGVDITAFTKRQSEPKLLYYYNTSYINSSHFSRDAFDTDNFDYVAYQVYFAVHANQYATFTVTDLPGQNGEIVSILPSSSSTYSLNVKGPTYSADKRVWTYTIDPQNGRGYNDHWMYRYYWVTVAYPKSEGNIVMEDGRIFTRYTNEADIVATALHKQNPDDLTAPPPDHNDEDAMNDATFIEWGDYRWKPSGKIFYYDKQLNKALNSGGLTIMQYGEDITAGFRMQFYANGDELYMDGVHEYYRLNITDNELWLRGTVNGGKTDFVKLEPGDYEITSISVSITANKTDHTTGEKLANPPLGQFILQGQRNETGSEDGEWENITTFQWPTGDNNQSKSFSATGLSGRGYTGYRIQSPRVNEYLEINTTFTVRLNGSSDKVKELLKNGESLTQVELLNIAAFPMETQEPDGSWQLYTNIYRDYSGAVDPKVPSHTDNYAVLVDLYGHDPDRLTYGNEVELIYDHALTTAGPLTSNVGSSKNTDSVVADTATEIVRAQFTLNSYQTISNYNDIPTWLSDQIIVQEGYFYDLLPEGWEVDPTFSVIVRRFNPNSSNSNSASGAAVLVGDPQIIDNYKGTNRQMVIYHVRVAGDRKNMVVYGNNGYSGFSITIGACQSFEDNALYPRGYNIAVFQGVEYDENGNSLYDENGNYIPQVWELMHTTTNAYYDDGVFGNSVYNVERDDGQYVFYDVNGDGITDQNDVLYMNSFVNPNFAKFVESGVDKLIKGKSGVWQLHDVTDLDTDYYYWLNFRTSGAGKGWNVVIYDVLENAANTAGHKDEHYWKGTFKSIDVSAAIAMGIDAKVYYSTATNLDENNNWQSVKDGKITADKVQMDIDKRPDLWSLYDENTAPKDKITAIAVDLRKTVKGEDKVFEGSENEEAFFTITMHSPEHLPEDREAILAYNRTYYQVTLYSSGEPTDYWNINDRVTIELKDLKTVRLKKITRSDPLVDDKGQFILDKDGNYTYEELPLGSVYFQLYKLTCTTSSHSDFAKHSAPPATYTLSGASSNNCWTRIAIGQTQADGTVAFEDLEEGIYALREYNPYYDSSNSQYTYEISYGDRLQNMWWSFEVDTHSDAEPVLVYRGSTTFSGDNYKDFVFGNKDSVIGDPDAKDLTRLVMNVRSYQSLTLKKQWWPALEPVKDANGNPVKDADGNLVYDPASIKVNILRNGEVYLRDVELLAKDNWSKVIYDLPVTSAYGTRYYYTVEETEATREALKNKGYEIVVDNNNYNTLSGRYTTITVGNGEERHYYWTLERRLHNSKLDHLVLTKFVAEGGDREKQYQFSLRLLDRENYVLSGKYDYTLYRLVEKTDADSGKTVSSWEAVKDGTFQLDANGTWGQLMLAHNERIVIHNLPVGTQYTLTEVGADGYKQTTTKGSLSGEIKDSKDNDDLITAEGDITNEVRVTNTYSTEGRTAITANKTINGRLPEYFTDKTFNYYLKEVAWAQYDTAEDATDGAVLDNVQDVIKTYRLNGSSRVLINFEDNNHKGYRVTNVGSGAITFPTILWESGISGYEGYRVYTLREVHMVEDPETGKLKPDEERPGYEDGMDTTVFVIWVELKDNTTGTLESNITYYKLREGVYEVDVTKKDTWIKLNGLADFQFNNTYKAEGELKLPLTKTINGIAPEDGPFKEQTFEFTLTNSDTGKVLATVTNDGSGEAVFDVGKFTIDDVGSNQFFRYTLTEKLKDETGLTIDSSVYAITLQITDKGKGRLGGLLYVTKDRVPVTTSNVSIDLPLEGEEDYDTLLQKLLKATSGLLKFDNKYEATGSWTQIQLEKQINESAANLKFYKNHTFTFTLSSVDADGKETLISTVQNGDDGKALFNSITYDISDLNKTYTYVIRETGTEGDGIKISDVPWTVVLRVDDAGDGDLTPTVLSIKQGEDEVWNAESEEAQPVFTFDNVYEAEGELTIEGVKELTGRKLRDKEFVFAILDEDGKQVAEGVNDVEGKITFEPIEYELKDVGTHTYKVVEVDKGVAGITYDDVEWELTTTVTDNGDGTLKVTYQLSKPKTETP